MNSTEIVSPELIGAMAVLAVLTVLPFAVIFWLWTRHVFTTTTRVVWTLVVLLVPVAGASAAVLAHAIPARLARGGSPDSTPAQA